MRVPLSHDFKQQAAKCLFPYLKPLSTESVFTVWIIARQGIGAAGKWLETIQQLFPILTGTSALFTFKPVEFTALFQLRREASDLIWTDIPDLPGIPPENVFYFKPPRSRKKIIDSGFDPYTPLRDWLGRNFTIVSNSIRLRQKKDLPRLFDAIPVISARRSLSASAITCVPIVNQIMFLGGETAHQYSGTEGKALHFILAHDDSELFQKDLEDEFGLRPPSASALVKKLAAAAMGL